MENANMHAGLLVLIRVHMNFHYVTGFEKRGTVLEAEYTFQSRV
jgi:hypothetical protein